MRTLPHLAELGTLDTLPRLQEEIALFIRESEAIQLERVNAYLDGIVLGAQQVQDVRLSMLEQPPQPSGWSIFANVLLTFFLESALVGRFVVVATTGIFGPILRSTSFFMRLPRTAARSQLVQRAERLARMNVGRRSAEETFQAVIRSGLGNATSASQGGRLVDQLPFYHDSLVALATGRWDPTNVVAVAKAVRDGASKLQDASIIVRNDSPSVAIIGEAMAYAAQTRLALSIRHRRTEALVRAGAFTPGDLAEAAEAFDWGELTADGREGSPPVELGLLRNHYRLITEAVIWARLYGFVPNQSPFLRVNQDGFQGIPQELTNYWRGRFAELVDTWAAPKGRIPTSFRTQPGAAQVIYLREFFWDIVRSLPRLPDGALSTRP